LHQAMIEESLRPKGVSPMGNVDLIGNADGGDVHGKYSSQEHTDYSTCHN
jgi:hypothetical protein